MFDDLKEALGEKGFKIILIGGAVLFVAALALSSRSTEDDEVLVSPTGYMSYPDAVTNANTIIDSVNQFTEYTGDRVIASTSGYMEEGIDRILSGMASEFDEIDGSIAGLGGTLDSVAADVGTIKTDLGTVKQSVSSIQSGMTSIKSDVSSVKTSTSSVFDRTRESKAILEEIKALASGSTEKVVLGAPTSVPSGVMSTPNGSGNYGKTSYTGNSLVDGLKAAGVYSLGGKAVDDPASRVALAKANGISDYTGTPAQNTQLLNKLKTGTLKKV